MKKINILMTLKNKRQLEISECGFKEIIFVLQHLSLKRGDSEKKNNR